MKSTKYIYVNLKTGMLNDRYVGIHCGILLKVSMILLQATKNT